MIREKVTHKDYFRIARKHDYFLWHFLQKNQEKSGLGLSSIIDLKDEHNKLPFVMDDLDIPYYESYTEDSLDFLIGLGLKYEHLYRNRGSNGNPIPHDKKFGAVVVGFKKFTKVSSTFDYCYCPEGVVEVIKDLGPEPLEILMKNISEKNPD